MGVGEANSAYASAFVEELARSGLRHACVSPGSRSTPLAVALAENPRVRVWMHLDERSGGYFALGLAKQLREPVALLCTSGTAAANYFPTVVEASYGRVPLLVLTADRPPELRDCGAPQAIDQLKLYGDHVKWYAEMALPEEDETTMRYVRTVACRSYATAQAAPAGPVHLNFPFREPLLPEVASRSTTVAARGDGRPYTTVSHGRRAPEPGVVASLADELGSVERGLVVCGPQDDPELPDRLAILAAHLGYPILADPLSGMRVGTHSKELAVVSYDAFLRDPTWVAEHAPEVVLRFGAMPTSKPLTQYLARFPSCRHVVVDGGNPWRDATMLASDTVYADPALSCDALTTTLDAPRRERTPWTREWLETGARAADAIEEKLADIEEPFEGRVFSELRDLLPHHATLYVGNSMPVRDLDTFFGSTEKAIRILCNRGANGIDGVVSSALGASTGSGGPTVLVIGDVSFLHDLNGLLAARLHDIPLTIVLLNNDGGGIFSFLQQAGHIEHFERLFGTPHGLKLSPAVGMYGGRFLSAQTWEEFRDGVSQGLTSKGLTVVEVRTDRERNVALHREVWRAVSEALRAKVGAAN